MSSSVSTQNYGVGTSQYADRKPRHKSGLTYKQFQMIVGCVGETFTL